jgi:hypothetical protein
MSAVLVPNGESTLAQRVAALKSEIARIRAEGAAAAQENRRLTDLAQREHRRAAGLRAQISTAEAARDAAAAQLQRVRMDGGDEAKALSALEAAERKLAQTRQLESQAVAAERAAGEFERQRVQVAKAVGDLPARAAALGGDWLEAQADGLGDEWLAMRHQLEALAIRALALENLLTKAGRIGGLALAISSPWAFAVPNIPRGAGRNLGPGTGLSALKFSTPQAQGRVRAEMERITAQLRAEGL